MPYPQCEKLRANGEAIDVLLEFCHWLIEDERIVLAKWHDAGSDDVLVSVTSTPAALIYRYFEIDEDKLESERRKMLNVIRRNNEKD